MMIISRMVLSVIVIMVSACATDQGIPLKKAGATKESTYSDYSECNQRAWRYYPEHIVNLMEGRYRTSCKTQFEKTYCTTEPYPDTPYDSNQNPRFDFNAACMTKKGYTN